MKWSRLAGMEAQDKAAKQDSKTESKGSEKKRSSAKEVPRRDTFDLASAAKRNTSLNRAERKPPARKGKAVGGGEKAEVRRAAVEKARTLKSVKKMKICHIKDLDVWRVTLYVDQGAKIDLKQYIWNAEQGNLQLLLVSKRIPAAKLDEHINKMQAGRVCEILTQARSTSDAHNWARVSVEELVGGGRTKKMGSIAVPSVPPSQSESVPQKKGSKAALSNSSRVLAKVITDRREVGKVKRFLARWQSAVERKDLKALRQLYHGNFSAGDLDYQGILQAAKKRFREHRTIRMELDQVKLTKKNDRILVNLAETLWEDGHRTTKRKTLVLEQSPKKGFQILTELATP
jgi:hypothetical protein